MIRVAVRELAPVTMVFLRTGIAAALLLPLAARRGELRPLLARWRPLLAYTAVEVALPWLLLGRAETKLTSSLTGLLIAAVPLVGALIVTLSGERARLGGRRWLGLLVGLVGVAGIVGLDIGRINHGQHREAKYSAGPVTVQHAPEQGRGQRGEDPAHRYRPRQGRP